MVLKRSSAWFQRQYEYGVIFQAYMDMCILEMLDIINDHLQRLTTRVSSRNCYPPQACGIDHPHPVPLSKLGQERKQIGIVEIEAQGIFNPWPQPDQHSISVDCLPLPHPMRPGFDL